MRAASARSRFSPASKPAGSAPTLGGVLVAAGYSVDYLALHGDPVNGVSPEYVDGGLIAHAPDALALHEAQVFFARRRDDVFMLSIGTSRDLAALPAGANPSRGLIWWMSRSRLPETVSAAQQALSLQPRIGLAAGNAGLLRQWMDWIAENGSEVVEVAVGPSVLGTFEGGDHAREFGEHRVAGGVAEGVVDDLELVQVQVAHGAQAFVLPHPIQQRVHHRRRQAPGERVELARVVAADQDRGAVSQGGLGPVAEARPRPRQR